MAFKVEKMGKMVVYQLLPDIFSYPYFTVKKMFNQNEEKKECAVGNREMGFWQYKKAEIVLLSFLTS